MLFDDDTENTTALCAQLRDEMEFSNEAYKTLKEHLDCEPTYNMINSITFLYRSYRDNWCKKNR
jgi:hypothetical protein